MKESQSLRQLGALISQQINPATIPQDVWPTIINEALHHGLAPMLLWIVKQNSSDVIIDPLWDPVVREARITAIHYISLETTRKQVSAALSAAHIPALWLKGIALAHTIYPQPVLRSMGDLDVLVPYEQREEALQVVEELGYHFYQPSDRLRHSQESLDLNLSHHFNLIGGINNSVVLELHFRLLSTDDGWLSLEKLQWFWSQTLNIENDSQFTILQPEAHLLYLCAHALLQHGETKTSLRQYFDLHQIVTNRSLDWHKIIEQSSAWGWNYIVDRALFMAVKYFSTPIPPTVFTDLRKSQLKHDAIAEHAMRIQGRGARWEKTLFRLHQLSRAGQVDLIRRIMFPTRAYMRTRYRVHSGRRIWPFYLYRWFDQSQEIIWAMGNRLAKTLRRGG